MSSRRSFLATAGLSLLATPNSLPGSAAPKSPLSPAELPPADARDVPQRDARLVIREATTACPPPRAGAVQSWSRRAASLREQILSAAGLWPFPDRTPLRPQIFDRMELDGFTLEKVYFESFPGFYCTGNLFRPRNRKGPFPGVLNPHGHWNAGRLENALGDQGHASVPQRCMFFARQGYVSFAYDMVGYNDSVQASHSFGCAHPGTRGGPCTDTVEEGLRLGLWGISLLGLQLWNSIRAIDFLTSLPDVDPNRIAATGASGGGTQTLLLTAVDDRVRVAAPVNMISHYFQGDCVCEGAHNLRIDTSNIEFAAMTAPRPLLMVAATGDWTRDTPRVEYPAVAAFYRMLGASGQLQSVQLPFPHNYNQSSREAVYRFFSRWLQAPGAEPGPLHEQDGQEFSLTPSETLVFYRRPRPPSALTEHRLAEMFKANARRQITEVWPRSAAGIDSFRQRFAPVYRSAVLAETPPREDLRWCCVDRAAGPGGERQHLLLGRRSRNDRIPAQFWRPSKPSGTAVLLIDAGGSAAALGTPEAATPLANAFSRQSCMVLAIDAFQCGKARDPQRRMQGTAFTTYNRTDEMERIQDVLTALAWLDAAWKPQRLLLAGTGDAGLWCLLARPFFHRSVAVAADLNGFDRDRDESYLERLRIPLLRRAGDFQTSVLLAEPSPLLLYNTGNRFRVDDFRDAYAWRKATSALRIEAGPLAPTEVARWLLRAG